MLRSLTLSGNLLSELKPLQLTGMPGLTSLLLDRNQIARVEKGALDGLTSLETLDLRSVCILARVLYVRLRRCSRWRLWCCSFWS